MCWYTRVLTLECWCVDVASLTGCPTLLLVQKAIPCLRPRHEGLVFLPLTLPIACKEGAAKTNPPITAQLFCKPRGGLHLRFRQHSAVHGHFGGMRAVTKHCSLPKSMSRHGRNRPKTMCRFIGMVVLSKKKTQVFHDGSNCSQGSKS